MNDDTCNGVAAYDELDKEGTGGEWVDTMRSMYVVVSELIVHRASSCRRSHVHPACVMVCSRSFPCYRPYTIHAHEAQATVIDIKKQLQLPLQVNYYFKYVSIT